MRKLTALGLALLMGTTLFLSACGDDKEGNSKVVQDFCNKQDGSTKDACKCYGDKVSQKYSTDEINKMNKEGTFESTTEALFNECIGVDDGGGRPHTRRWLLFGG